MCTLGTIINHIWPDEVYQVPVRFCQQVLGKRTDLILKETGGELRMEDSKVTCKEAIKDVTGLGTRLTSDTLSLCRRTVLFPLATS